ncbi:hypothetical protein ACHAQJ_002821 [Trichoderma viride]
MHFGNTPQILARATRHPCVRRRRDPWALSIEPAVTATAAQHSNSNTSVGDTFLIGHQSGGNHETIAPLRQVWLAGTLRRSTPSLDWACLANPTLAPRRKRVQALGTFDVAVPSSLPLVPSPSAVNTVFAQFPFDPDPQLLVGQAIVVPDYFSFGNIGYTSGYSPDHTPVYFSGLSEGSQKRRRLEGFYQMPSVDEPSSSSTGYEEKLPIAGHYDHQQVHDAASITPRWAPAIPDVQSLSSPLARMAESITNCCNFGWQQPTGYQPLPSPTAVVYDPPQQSIMEALPPMLTQTRNSLQYTVPDNGRSSEQASLPNDQHIVPGDGEPPQHESLSSDLLNLHSLPLDIYPTLVEASLQNLPQSALQPLLQESLSTGNTGGDLYSLNHTGREYPGQLDNTGHENPTQNLTQPTTQPATFEERVNQVGQKQDSNADNQQRNGKRGPFRDQTLREQTAQTRRMGSCLRCRMQRIRCEFNSDIPGSCCLPCKKVENTKAARLPCLRYKITDMTLYKPGQVPGYEWTQRWTKTTSDPIQLWASSEVRLVYISVCFSTVYLPLEVRRFVPQEGDKLERTWDYKGTKKSALIPPYALIDLEAGKSAYTSYIRDSMTDIFKNMLGDADALLYKTYLQAWHIWKDPATPTETFDLLNWTLRLWVAVRLSTTSAFIVGTDTLGMPADILDKTNPDRGKIPLPPVMGAQMDMILIQHIQAKLRHELLDNLQKVMLRNKPTSWLVTYLVSFILLHNIALITKHDARYAVKHGMNRRFAREGKVREYHMAHFHYCNKGRIPFSDECEDKDLRALAHLDEDKIKFVRATRAHVQRHQQDWEQIRAKGAYENDYYFLSQLFDEKWQPSTTVL